MPQKRGTKENKRGKGIKNEMPFEQRISGQPPLTGERDCPQLRGSTRIVGGV
jgi:hypothetical protein